MEVIENIKDYYNEETKVISMPDKVVEIPKEGLGHTLFHSMKRSAGKIALIDIFSNQTLTYDDLYIQSVRTAIHLKTMGIKPGDIISVCSHNQFDAVVTFLSAFLVGAVNASLDPILSDIELTNLVTHIDVKVFFVAADCEERIQGLMKKLKLDSKIVVFGESLGNVTYSEFSCPKEGEDAFEPYVSDDVEEMCLILFSSGSTGLPKPIVFSHKYLLYHTSTISGIENIMGLTNLYWTGAVQTLLLQIRKGNQYCILSKFDPIIMWNAVEKYKVNTVQLFPHLAFEFIKYKPEDKEINLLYFSLVGDSMSVEKTLQIREALPKTKVATVYAMSETAQLLNPLCPKAYMKVSSAGVPLAGIHYKVVDLETQQNVGFNQRGELRVKSSYHFSGYLNRDISDCWDEEGYFKTGDVVYFDEDFSFFIVDRIKDMFKFKGRYILPDIYEKVLESHPDINIAIIMGISTEIYGNKILAVVVPREGSEITEKDVEDYYNPKVIDIARLTAGVKFMETLPMLSNGKVARYRLKQMILKDTK